jgi:hypothetical protein
MTPVETIADHRCNKVDWDLEEQQTEERFGKYCAKWNCDKIRKMIQEFLATKEMTQTKFLVIIGNVNSNSYRNFMKLKGPYTGANNGTYSGAIEFFAKRDEAKKAIPASDKKRKREQAEAAGGASKTKDEVSVLLAQIAATPLPPLPTPEGNGVTDLSYYREHAVYLSCDEVRKQAMEFLAASGIKKAEFFRAIGNVQSKSWNDFIGNRGAGEGVYMQPGAANSCYYNAACFLERLRIVRGEAKSAKRMKFADEHPRGYMLRHDNGKRWVCKGMPM